MRRLNAIITALIIPLFLVHLIWGSLILTGMTNGGSRIFRLIATAMLFLIAAHVTISIKLTVDTIRAVKRSGTFYWRENLLFLIRRISGFAMLFFILAHVLIFQGRISGGAFRLNLFDAAALASQILMVVSLLLHLCANITPLRIALGLRDGRNIRTDLAFILAILLLLAGAAFIVYYLRWQVI